MKFTISLPWEHKAAPLPSPYLTAYAHLLGQPSTPTAPKEKPMATPAVTPAPETLAQKIVADEKKFVSFMETVGKEAARGLAFVAKESNVIAPIAAILVPTDSPEIATANTVIQAVNNAVVEIQTKAALLPAGLTDAQKSADVLALIGPVVTPLLVQAKLPTDATYVQYIINLVVAALKVQPSTATT